MNRLGRKVQQLIKRSPSQALAPFLSAPIEVETEVPVAYRNNLLAFYAAPGLYRLVSLDEQFIWTREMLVDEEVTNASGKGMRRLANCRNLGKDERYWLAESCQGIVGVACRGYHSLNRASADKHGKRIGDCMVEVRWSGRYDRSRHVLALDFNTWETREDWEDFRGIRRAMWEIYYFAKCRENGQYP